MEIVYTGSGHPTVTPGGESINAGDLVTITAESGKTKLESNTKLEIMQGGTLLQELEIHTSCSQPLNIGDQFGSLVLVGFIPGDER